MYKMIALISLAFLAACDRPPPVLKERMPSPDGKWELAVWEEESAGILDGNMIATVNAPGSKYDDLSLVIYYKRARSPVFYWSTNEKIVFVVADLHGGIVSRKERPDVTVCGIAREVCEAALPPVADVPALELPTYTSGESELFAEE